MIDSQKSSKPRMMLRFLHQSKLLSDDQLTQAMTKNLSRTQPFHHADIYIQLLSWILIATGIICLTAFNWFQMSDFTKLAIAEIALIPSFGAILFTKKPHHKSLAGAIFTLMIGVFWAIFGQIYQINSSIYHFSLIWCICLLPFAIILRQQFITIITALLFYSTLMLYLPLHYKIFYFSSLTSIAISALFTFVIIFAKRFKIPSIANSICYIFFSITLLALLGSSIEFLFRSNTTTAWLITLFSSIIAIFILIHLNEKTMMIALYLYTIFMVLLRLFSLSHLDIVSLTLTMSICAIIAIYPTYKGAIWLIHYANKVNHNEQP
ncbi:DUF2157 domain-containing protein [Wohlfahrtiimonas larvae]|uniref:DUF2157 domain-containing protein n=1 Tax=Wohlfahrtiimonas larvae TaxID=1157986 RepID=A0ABP9ME82_9GAMM|nr:DUF2157 domain-containing protein [Wohlfahrtiimonas larvae]